jgi:hypothetical protein
MKSLIINQDERLGPWICDRLGTEWLSGRGSCIGLEEAGEIVAGVLFDSCNGASVMMHVAAIPGKRWMTRELLWICFDYPFNQLGVKKIIGLVASRDESVIAFDTHLGFVHEATLKDAHPSGDLLLLTMTRAQCRWLHMRSPYGKAESPESA